MNHPNIQPTAAQTATCSAASRAADRNQVWLPPVPASEIHGASGRKNRWLTPFDVTFGGRRHRFFLSKAGIVFLQACDGYIPVNFAEFTYTQLHGGFIVALNAIASPVRAKQPT